jgi:hypothetical protein
MVRGEGRADLMLLLNAFKRTHAIINVYVFIKMLG